MIEGIKRSKLHEKDHRLPITRELLNRILSILSIICTSNYETDLFRAAFLLAFHGFFRVGELTVGHKGDHIQRLIIENVKLVSNYFEIFLVSSKTDQIGTGTTISISAKAEQDNLPLASLIKYLKGRPAGNGSLFCHFDSKPLTRYQFSSVLKHSLVVLSVSGAQFTSHSLRIGMATTYAMEGAPDDQKVRPLEIWGIFGDPNLNFG